MALPVTTVIGNLTADPELRYTQNGRPVATITVAANDRYKDANGEWKDGDTTFLRGTVWGGLAEQLPANLHKGSKVIIVGRIKQHSYETKEGEKRSTLELDVQEIGAALKPAPTRTEQATPWPTAQPDSYSFGDEPF